MGLVYQDDEDLYFLQHCSEEQLKMIAELLTHDDTGGVADAGVWVTCF